MTKSIRKQTGFTLIEMLVIAPIVILTIGAFLTAVISMTGEVVASRASNAQVYNIQDALNRIEEDVKQSAAFLPATDVTIASPQGYNDATQAFTNVDPAYKAMILSMVATTDNPLSNESRAIFTNTPNPCDNPALASTNRPLTYNVVYFVKNNTLWRRTVMNSNYATAGCSVPWQVPSCTAGSGGNCFTNDIKLVEGVTNFTVNYYSDATENYLISNAYSTTLSTRTAALLSAPTITATISATQQAGGRDVTNSASVHVSRLATNASAIKALAPPTTPIAPTVTANSLPAAKTAFYWNAVPGATGYKFEYKRGDDGSWTLGFNNPNDAATRTYTLAARYNGEIVQGRVTAITSGATTPSGTPTILSVTTPVWEPLAMSNGWTLYDNTHTTPAYTKTAGGVILVKGFIKRSGTPTDGEIIGTLPDGYRPQNGRITFGNMTSGNASGRIDVDTNGQILYASGSATWFSLDTVRFYPSSSYYTAALTNGWTNAGCTCNAKASYIQAPNYRVFTQGRVAPGTTTNGTRIFSLDSSMLPSNYLLLSTMSDGWAYIAARDTSAGTNSGIAARNSGSGNISVTTDFLNYSYGGWLTTGYSFGTNWRNFANSNNYSAFKYTKTADNLVSLQGVVEWYGSGSPSSSSLILTLPVDYRPKERLVLPVASAGNLARIEISTDGTVRWMAGSTVQNDWLSLDGITFLSL